jgi:integrase
VALFQVTADGSPFSGLVRMLLLTGQRLAKVRDMQHQDVKDGIWTIRTMKREKGNAGKLKLCDMALEVLATTPRVEGNEYVFVNASANGSIGNLANEKERLDRAMRKHLPEMRDWVLHDLRRSARSLMARAQVPREIAERVLGHAVGTVESIYNRHDYEAEMADALLRLERLIMGIVNPPPAANVIPVHQHVVTG